MGKHLLYLIGQPGSGKSTLLAGLTEGLTYRAEKKPFAHLLWAGSEPVVELGARRPMFSGTDALSMSVQPLAVAYLTGCPYRLMIAEGDRLANLGFLTAAQDAGWDVLLARLIVSAAVADHRRARRAAELETAAQNEAWLRGRVSKVRNLADAWPGSLLEVDADASPERVLTALRAAGNPVVAALTG